MWNASSLRTSECGGEEGCVCGLCVVWRGGEGCMCGVKGGMYVWCGGVCVWRRGVVGGEGCSYGIGVCSALLIYHTPFFSSQS